MRTGKLIVIAEDEPNDLTLLQHALTTIGFGCDLVHVLDGAEAIEFLASTSSSVDQAWPRVPDLVVLDLKMPKVDGFGVLQWLRQQPRLQDLPAVVLSSSNLEEDRTLADNLGARAYYVKPTGLTALIELARELTTKWLGPGEPK